jgi:hypothetical protein
MASNTWIESQTPSVLPPGVEASTPQYHVSQTEPAIFARSEVKRKRTLLQQDDAGEPIIEVPEVDTAHAPLVVQLPVDVKGLVGLDLHPAHPLAGDGALAGPLALAGAAHASRPRLVQGRVELVGPGRPVAVAVAVVVAEEELAARVLAALDREGLVDGREEVLGQVGGQGDDGVEVLGCMLGVEASEQVPIVSRQLWLVLDGIQGILTTPSRKDQQPPSLRRGGVGLICMQI